MLPKEHGAYAQLGFPLATALILGGPRPAALLLTVAIIAVFLIHEPVMILIGGRGGRARREEGDRARRYGLVLGAVAVASGLLGLWLAPPVARASSLIPAGLSLLLVPLTLSRREKTTAGELLVATALPLTLVPVATSGEAGLDAALVAAAVWAIVFALGTLTVRAIIARAKRNVRPAWPPVLAPVLSGAVIAAAVALALSRSLPIPVAIAAVPTALVALIFGSARVHPRNLRRMGWSLVASNLVVLAALIIGLD